MSIHQFNNVNPSHLLCQSDFSTWDSLFFDNFQKRRKRCTPEPRTPTPCFNKRGTYHI